MTNLAFECSACGQHLEAPEDMAGEVVECPACGQSIKVPASGADTRMEEGIGENTCPACGAPMQPDDVLCLACGYHKGLGRRIETEC